MAPALELIRKMLAFDPELRPSARAALAHATFDALRDENAADDADDGHNNDFAGAHVGYDFDGIRQAAKAAERAAVEERLISSGACGANAPPTV